MSYKFDDNINIKTFNKFVYSHKYGTFFQSENWAKLKSEWTAIYTGVFKDDKLKAVALVLKRNLFMGYSFLYAPRALVVDYNDKELVSYYLENLKKLSKKHKAISLTIDPYVARATYDMNKAKKANLDINYDDSLISLFEENDFKFSGFVLDLKDSIQPRFQPVINIKDDTYKNSRAYKSGIRALNNNVSIRRGHLDEIENFSNIIKKSADYKNISLRTSRYFEMLLNAFKDDTLITIANLDLKNEEKSLKLRLDDLLKRLDNPTIKEGRRNEYESQVSSIKKDLEFISNKAKQFDSVDIGGLLVIKNANKAELLYAGMDREYLKYAASNVNYIDAINYAREFNLDKLYLGGSSGYLNEGVDFFKASFNPDLEELIGEFVYVNKKFLNFSFNKLRELRSRYLSRKK